MMKKFFGILVMTILTLAAFSGLAGACWWYGYQPEVPKSLLK
jgi:cyclic lactone autoinducer peptide